MNGTWVLREACATVANSSPLRKPSAATSIRAPRLRTGFSLSCRRGSDAASVGLAGALVVFGAAAFLASAVAALDRGFAAAEVAAGAGAVVDTVSAGFVADRMSRSLAISLTDGPTATPSAKAPTKAAVRPAALPTVMFFSL